MQDQTTSDREAKLAAVHDTLTRSVAALVSGEDWRRALEFAAKFRSRSFSNTLLIYVQHFEAYEQGRVPDPVPTFVAGYRQWQSLGHQVRRGAGGYAILAPVVARFAATGWADPRSAWRRLGPREKSRPGEILRTQLISTKVAHVWDASSTDGPPIPAPPAPRLLRGRAPDGLWDGLVRQVIGLGFALRVVPDAGALDGANGVTNYLTRTVSIRADVDDASKCRTLGHELAHVLLHGPVLTGAASHRGIAEVEAESVALMLFAAHQMDTSQYTVPYVSTWAATVPGKDPVEVVTATADRVRKTALAILDRMDTHQVGNGDPPGLDRAPHTARPFLQVPAAAVPGPGREPVPDLDLGLVAEPDGVTL
ncbi:ArdC-like ssDNA-binding domain-containing protein [Pengzhenrongella sicca]|uniref:Serine/arginine repetitive matrix protein 2 n=1 Tax=Pengzhenrongella sicca TaxID=2819238 RepID=A0A8A4Z9V3_9MICO|nr:ArdC-like ssDNA-binding domain-containing protein [Pengzhenrongella sicca]QTE28624.1 serine/arginine repetitive matrix protein 2 [Pengzhenrongella sicca]